jgi:hypothetical protein
MLDRKPECAEVIEQLHESLFAIRLHIINYRLQVLQLSLRNPEVSSGTFADPGKKAADTEETSQRSH